MCKKSSYDNINKAVRDERLYELILPQMHTYNEIFEHFWTEYRVYSVSDWCFYGILIIVKKKSPKTAQSLQTPVINVHKCEVIATKHVFWNR